MLSRIADSLFWLNRYIERSDTILRLVYVHYILSLDQSAYTTRSWQPVLELCTNATPGEIKLLSNDTAASLQKILLESTNPNSLCNLVTKARENAKGAQDHLTKEVWEVVNQLYHTANDSKLLSRLEKDQAVKVIESFSRSTVLFAGITDNTMWRGLGWNFMQLGKFIERCLQSNAIVLKQLELFAAANTDTKDILQWRHLLLSLSGYEMHLKTYRSQDHNQNVLQQVLLDENFTRSLLYSLIRINHYVENIMLIHEDGNKEIKRSLGRLLSKVKYMDLQRMDRRALRRFLLEVNNELVSVSNLLAQYFFSYT